MNGKNHNLTDGLTLRRTTDICSFVHSLTYPTLWCAVLCFVLMASKLFSPFYSIVLLDRQGGGRANFVKLSLEHFIKKSFIFGQTRTTNTMWVAFGSRQEKRFDGCRNNWTLKMKTLLRLVCLATTLYSSLTYRQISFSGVICN